MGGSKGIFVNMRTQASPTVLPMIVKDVSVTHSQVIRESRVTRPLIVQNGITMLPTFSSLRPTTNAWFRDDSRFQLKILASSAFL